MKDFIIENSKMTAEQLDNMDLDSLESLSKSVAPKQKYLGNGKAGGNKLQLLDDNTFNGEEA